MNELPTRIEIGGVPGQGFLTPPPQKKKEKLWAEMWMLKQYCIILIIIVNLLFFPHLRIFLNSPVASLPAVPESLGQYCFHRKKI